MSAADARERISRLGNKLQLWMSVQLTCKRCPPGVLGRTAAGQSSSSSSLLDALSNQAAAVLQNGTQLQNIVRLLDVVKVHSQPPHSAVRQWVRGPQLGQRALRHGGRRRPRQEEQQCGSRGELPLRRRAK